MNNGHIIACRFTGMVSGSASTGAIAGKNAVTGGIYGCTVSGAVYGESMTGGIAGYNLGLISACRSSAYVNTESRDKTFSVQDISVDVSTDLAKLSARSADEPVASDTGGIAGYSAGIIRGCVNEATVGYQHVGYNVGGIAGRSCGYMISCTNKGEVYGRKDVGGIVGQMEPYTELSLTDGSLATMQRQLNELNAIINQTAYDAAGSGSAVFSRLNEISAYVDRAIAEAGSIDVNIGGGDGTELPDISYDPDTGIEIPDSGGYDIVVTPDISGLTAALSAINGQLSLLNGEMSASGGTVANDIIAANAKFNELMNSVFSAIYSVGTSAAGIVTDTSAVNIADVRLGKVCLSENTGAVSGDINVGGVAGAIAIEQVLDPEDDLSPEISAENKREYELKAVLTECTNRGAVSALRSCAGSVAGRTELGIVTLCYGYGDVTSDSGDYVGGIVGLTSAAVRSNWVKCTLSGGKYVGGIVGSGTEETLTGAGSTVAGNVSMVAITDAAQYYGAISGADAGTLTENLFVSDTLAGIDGVNYAGRADRMSYAALCVLPGCPDDMRRLTLTFEADGEVIKEVSFQYGASFGADVYPELPAKDGYSGRWDITELRSLHLDTRVTAVYDRERTAISTATQRGGRSVILVEGAYAPTDSVTDSDSTVESAPGNVLEQRHITLPSDGQSAHTVHYLPPEVTSGSVAVYVTQNGRWTRAVTESFGSYLAFTVEGDAFDLAAVAEGGSARIIMAAAGAIAAAALVTALIINLRRRRGAKGGTTMDGIKNPAKTAVMGAEVFPAEGAEKQKNPRRKKLVILAVCLVLLAGIAAAAFALLPRVSGVLTPYRALTSLCSSPQLEMNISVDATVGGAELEAGIPVSVGTFDGVRVTCAQLGSAPLYFAENMLILENGRAYALGGAAPDYSTLLTKFAAVYKDVDVSADEVGNYSLSVGAEQADELLRILCPELGSDSLTVGSAVLTLKLTDGKVERIALAADGTLSGDTAFTVDAVIDGFVRASSRTLPEAVSAAIDSGNADSLDTLTDEVMNIISAWSALSSRESVTGKLALRADCGPVVLNTTLDVSSALTDGKRSYRIGKNDIGIDLDGSSGESGEQTAAKYVELADVVYLACISGDVTSRSTASGTVYTMALDSDSIARIVSVIAPEAEKLGAVFSQGTAELTVTNGEIDTIALSCTGTMKVVLTETAVSVSAELTVD